MQVQKEKSKKKISIFNLDGSYTDEWEKIIKSKLKYADEYNVLKKGTFYGYECNNCEKRIWSSDIAKRDSSVKRANRHIEKDHSDIKEAFYVKGSKYSKVG